MLAAGVFLLSLALYLATLAPTITWRFSGADSGELASAAYTWGVPHPTGYPLWTLLGFLITRVSFGDPAGRTSLLSALAGAGAATLVSLAALRLSGLLSESARPWNRFLAAAGAGLAYAVAPAIWSQAIITETYSLNSLLVALIIWLVSDRSPPRPRGRLPLACGLALTNHSTAIMTVVAAAVAVVLRREWRRWSAGSLLRGALLFVLPLTIYLLIPLRAAQHPAENWNDPQTLPRFYQLVTGAQYHYLLDLHDPLGLIRYTAAVLRLFLQQFAWWALPLAIYGLLLVWEVDWSFGVFTLVAVAAYAAFTVAYRARGADRYLLPAYAFEAVLLGAGLCSLGDELTSWARSHRKPLTLPVALLGAAVLLTILPFAAIHFSDHNLRNDHEAYDYARNTLAAAAPDATIRTHDDEQTFALWYLQKVEHVRRDVKVIDIRIVPGSFGGY